MYLVVKDGKTIGQEPWKEHPVNEGANCPKGKNAYDYIYSKVSAPYASKFQKVKI